MASALDFLQDPDFQALPDAEKEKVIQQMLAQDPEFTALPPPEQKQVLGKLAQSPEAGALKAVGSGAVEGLIGATIGLPGTVERLVKSTEVGRKVSDFISPPVEGLTPRSLPATEDISKFLGTDYQPQTQGEQFLHSVAAGGSSGILPLGQLSLPARIGLGSLSGLSGEIGARTLGEGGGRVVASLVPYLVASPWLLREPNVAKAGKEYLADVGEEGLRAAGREAASASARRGLPYLLSQGTVTRPPGFGGLKVPLRTPLTGMTEELATSPYGQAIRRVLERQLPAGQELVEETIAKMSPRGTGQTEANLISEAIKQHMEKTRAAPSGLSGDLYESAGRLSRMPSGIEPRGSIQAAETQMGGGRTFFVPRTTARDLVEKLRAERKTLGLTGAASGEPLEQTAQRIEDLIIAHGREGIPVLELDAISRESAIAAASKETKYKLRALGSQRAAAIINEALHEYPELSAAKKIHGAAAQAFVDPMEKSVLSSMLPKAAQKSGKGSLTALRSVFDGSPADIREAYLAMNAQDPEAWPNLVKSWMEQATRGVRGKEEILADWPTKLTSRPEVFQEVMRGVAEARGLPPDAYVSAAETLMNDLRMMGHSRVDLGRINAVEFARESGRNLPSEIARTSIFTPARGFGRVIERAVHRRTYKELSEAIAEGNVDELVRIAEYSNASERTKSLLQQLLATQAQVEANSPAK